MTTASTPSTAAIAEDLRTVIGRLVRRLRRDYTIPTHQFSVLAQIERGGPQTTSGLATVELVRPQTMAHTVQQLDEAGYVLREPDPSDGRQTLIVLSDAGRAAMAEQRRELTDWLASTIDRTLDAGERETLAEAVVLLARLIED
jgi:DNA-binding MarR family transcriptional regulator